MTPEGGGRDERRRRQAEALEHGLRLREDVGITVVERDRGDAVGAARPRDRLVHGGRRGTTTVRLASSSICSAKLAGVTQRLCGSLVAGATR